MGFRIAIPMNVPSPEWELRHILVSNERRPHVLLLFSDEEVGIVHHGTGTEIDWGTVRLRVWIHPMTRFVGQLLQTPRMFSSFVSTMDAEDLRTFRPMTAWGNPGYVASSISGPDGGRLIGALRLYADGIKVTILSYLTEEELLEVANSLAYT